MQSPLPMMTLIDLDPELLAFIESLPPIKSFGLAYRRIFRGPFDYDLSVS